MYNLEAFDRKWLEEVQAFQERQRQIMEYAAEQFRAGEEAVKAVSLAMNMRIRPAMDIPKRYYLAN